MWLTTVTVWLFSREGVAKSPCKCGSEGGIYMIIHRLRLDFLEDLLPWSENLPEECRKQT